MRMTKEMLRKERDTAMSLLMAQRDGYDVKKQIDSFLASTSRDPIPFYAFGNNGGDSVEIIHVEDNLVHLKIGMSCVYILDKIVPVEFITAAFAEIVARYGIWGTIQNTGWPKEFKDKLCDQYYKANRK